MIAMFTMQNSPIFMYNLYVMSGVPIF